jgi:hypothetical protein
VAAFTVNIIGVSSLLQHRFGEAAEAGDKNSRKIHIPVTDPRSEAEKVAYRDKHDNLYFPGSAVARLLREAGGAHKQRGSRKSFKFLIPAAVLVTEDAILLRDPKTGKPLTDFEVDSRPVTIPATKGRIMRHRPRLDAWQASFGLEIDAELIDAAFVQQLLSEGGRQIGIGDYRPSCGGPFGRFLVSRWEQVRQPKETKLAAD